MAKGLTRRSRATGGPSKRKQPTLRPSEAAAIREKAARNLTLFAKGCFPHHCRLPMNAMHRALMQWHRKRLTGTPIERRRGKSVAIAAPRGYAKSTWASLILPIHDLVYGHEKHIVLISATLEQAKQRLRNIRRELTENPHLRAVYGDIAALSREWTTRRVSVGDSVLEVFSTGSEMRGISHGPWRPTKIILDDAEESAAAESGDKREADLAWFNEVVENLGNGYTHTVCVGTVLHPDSLLMTLLRRPDYEGMLFRSVEQWANETDLWDEWRRLLTNLEDTFREETAHTFFEANCERMLEGVEVLWPEKESYEDLQRQLVTRGRSAFFQEKQNEPICGETQLFDVDRLQRFELVKGEIQCAHEEPRKFSELDLAVYLDPALGNADRRGKRTGDFAALVVAGRDDLGRVHVLDAVMRRMTPAQQAAELVALAKRWDCHRAGVEMNGFQQLLSEQIESARRDAGIGLAVEGMRHTGNKVTRVSRLEPDIANGWIRFRRDLTPVFFQQLGQFPRGAHDDGPDALEGVVAMLSASGPTRSGRTGRRTTLNRVQRY